MKSNFNFGITLFVSISLLAFTLLPFNFQTAYAQSRSKASVTKKLNIAQTAVASKDLTSLTKLLKKAALVEAFSAKGPFTVFAPGNSAFAKLAADPNDPQSVLAYVQSLEDQQTIDELTYLLKYHVVQGNYTSSTLKNNQKLTTLN
ncbi:MAG: fasciclin domain-containing protein, partial [Patescibacteria group bacterium]